jgi:two-component system KDP operon response regulator KdpE
MTTDSTSPLLLVVEDDPPMRRFLRVALTAAGYRVNEAATGTDGVNQAAMQPPDAILLDLGLPDIDGLEVVRRIRDWSQVPVVVISARGRERDKVVALDAGADDYLSKPFGVAELLARVRVALRHAARVADRAAGEATRFAVGELEIDLAARRVTCAGAEIHLTPIEYRLLATLAQHAGKVLTHDFLLKEIWGPGSEGQAHNLRVFLATLRRKIEAEPARPRYLLTEQGVGYRLVDE